MNIEFCMKCSQEIAIVVYFTLLLDWVLRSVLFTYHFNNLWWAITIHILLYWIYFVVLLVYLLLFLLFIQRHQRTLCWFLLNFIIFNTKYKNIFNFFLFIKSIYQFICGLFCFLSACHCHLWRCLSFLLSKYLI